MHSLKASIINQEHQKIFRDI
jgi:hypothetical protein